MKGVLGAKKINEPNADPDHELDAQDKINEQMAKRGNSPTFPSSASRPLRNTRHLKSLEPGR